MKLTRNVGGFDRVLRIGISILLIYFGFLSDLLISDTWAGITLGLFGTANLIVAVIGNCPLYAVIGFNTRHGRPRA